MEEEGLYWAQRFAELREQYRREDGSRWSGAALERATGGKATESWVSKLSRGKVGDPSFRRISAISQVMGIPLHEWEEPPGRGRS